MPIQFRVLEQKTSASPDVEFDPIKIILSEMGKEQPSILEV